jgi:hypothetical protein
VEDEPSPDEEEPSPDDDVDSRDEEEPSRDEEEPSPDNDFDSPGLLPPDELDDLFDDEPPRSFFAQPDPL